MREANQMLEAIELNKHETALAAQAKDADQRSLEDHDYERTVQAGRASRSLMELLLQQDAIPEVRLRYFVDPQYNGGNRKSSRRELFRRNAHSDEEMYEHPHFWKYLLFFIHGAKLPENVKSRLAELAADTKRDHGSLDKLARELCRSLREDNATKAEEFFKLAMDCDCTLTEGMNVRRAVMSAR
jgi:hypothetical protein